GREIRIQIALELEDQHDDLGLIRVELVERRDRDVDERRTCIPHDLQCVLEDRIGLRRYAKELSPYADASSLQAVPTNELTVIPEEMSCARCSLRIARVRTGEGAEHDGCIGKRTSVGTDRILSVRDWHDTCATRQSDGRLDASDAALSGRTHDRAVGFRRKRRRSERGRGRGAGSGAGTARITIENVRIAALTAHSAPAARALETAEVRPLAEIRFADDHCARIAQSLRDSSVLERGRADECERTGGRLLSIAGVDVVLEQNRNAVQRPARSAASSLLIELSSDVPRIRIQLNDRAQIEPLVDQLDSAQINFEQLLRAELMRRHERLQLPDALLGDLVAITAEHVKVLRSCIVGLCVGGERCESRSPGSQRAGLQKGATIRISQ